LSFVLDTSALSDLMGGDPPTISRLRSTKRTNVFLPGPVVSEVAYGLARLGKTKRARALTESLNLLLSEMQHAAWTDEVSFQFGRVKALLERKGTPNEDFDVAIAAHALSLQATLVTRNVRHYERVPSLVVEDWSAPAT
jgi:tRNA(fMet)-specific endonuclease VapC